MTEKTASRGSLRHVRDRWPRALIALGCMLAAGIYFSLQVMENERSSTVSKPGSGSASAASTVSGTLGATLTNAEEFSVKNAFVQLYGNYDPNLDGAFWTANAAPAGLAEWNGKALFIRPLISRGFIEGAHARQVLVTNSLAVRNGDVVKQGTGCKACGSLIGAAVFEKQNQSWKLISRHDFLTAGGSWGAPPQVSVSFHGSGAIELEFQNRSADRRESSKRSYAVVLKNRQSAARSVAHTGMRD